LLGAIALIPALTNCWHMNFPASKSTNPQVASHEQQFWKIKWRKKKNEKRKEKMKKVQIILEEIHRSLFFGYPIILHILNF